MKQTIKQRSVLHDYAQQEWRPRPIIIDLDKVGSWVMGAGVVLMLVYMAAQMIRGVMALHGVNLS